MEAAFYEGIHDLGDASGRDEFLETFEKAVGRSGTRYIDAVKALAPQEAETGSRWLQGIVENIKSRISRIISSSPDAV